MPYTVVTVQKTQALMSSSKRPCGLIYQHRPLQCCDEISIQTTLLLQGGSRRQDGGV